MRGYKCENCKDVGCDWCKPKYTFDPHKIERPYVKAWGHHAVYTEDYHRLLKMFNDKCSDLASMEVTLGNATSLAEFQAARIGKMEDENNKLKIKYALCDSDIPAGFEPDLEPSERVSAYIGKMRECLIDHHRLHGVRCFHSSRSDCPTMQLTDELLSPPSEVKEKI